MPWSWNDPSKESQTDKNWRGKGCKNYDDATDTCLDPEDDEDEESDMGPYTARATEYSGYQERNMTTAQRLINRVVEASPAGSAQTAIMTYLKSRGTAELNDMSSDPSFRGMNAGSIQAAARALATKGLVKINGMSITLVDDESAPPGMEPVVKALKKNPEVDNPFAVAWSMKNKSKK